MIVNGVVRRLIKSKKKLIIKTDNQILNIFISKRLIKDFAPYLINGRFVSICVADEKIYINDSQGYRINYFIKIIKNSKYKHEVFYDISLVKQGIKELVDSFENVMFLDFEMTMVVGRPEKFVTELVQAGLVVANKDMEIIYEYNSYIKPSKNKINNRTLKFLGLDKETINNGLSYNEFHEQFEKIINKFNPTIVVFGRNDIKYLQHSYVVNGAKEITKRKDFVDLLQVYKNYHNIRNDIALFKLYEQMTNDEIGSQNHDAFEDAKVTYQIFKAFKDALNKDVTDN